jgi:hypothetical protein
MNDFAQVNAVLQQVVQRPTRERYPAPVGAADSLLNLTHDAVAPQLRYQLANRVEFAIAPHYVPHCFSLCFIHNELAVLNFVSERDRATHPKPFAFGGGNFVADSLAGDLALELSERQQHIERQPTHAGRGVE